MSEPLPRPPGRQRSEIRTCARVKITHVEIVASDGVVLPCQVHPGRGATFVLLHGAGQNLAYWAEFVGLLGEHRVVVYDLRGHGQTSTTDNLSLDAQADDLAAVIAAVGEPKDVVPVGFSLGGYIVLHALARGLDCPGWVNIDGPFVSEERLYEVGGLTKDWREEQAMFERNDFVGTAADAEAHIRERRAEPDAEEAVLRRSHFLEGDLVRQRPSPTEWLRIREALWAQDVAAEYERVIAPALLVLATDAMPPIPTRVLLAAERANAARRLVEAHSSWRLLETNTSHFVPTAAPQLLADAMCSFIDGLGNE